MNVEIWYIVLMAVSGVLWSLGGTQISEKIGGQKWLRRILLPVILSLLLYTVFHVELWRCIAFFMSTITAFSLGYGDHAHWWKWEGSRYPKWFTALMMPLPILFVGWTPLILGYPLFFLGAFYVGSKSQWKTAEFFMGAGFGACLIAILK